MDSSICHGIRTAKYSSLRELKKSNMIFKRHCEKASFNQNLLMERERGFLGPLTFSRNHYSCSRFSDDLRLLRVYPLPPTSEAYHIIMILCLQLLIRERIYRQVAIAL